MDRFEVACSTHPGRVRLGNEDAIFGDASLGLGILADGMGGHAAGEVASRIAVDEVAAELGAALRHLQAGGECIGLAELHEDMHFAVRRANTAILRRASHEPKFEGMGSTLVVAVLQERCISVGHLGDSRAYRLRAGRLEQLTRDHCWAHARLAEGTLSIDDLLNASCRNVVTRALGVEEEVEFEVKDHSAQPGDLFLLCSDGLSNMLNTAQIEAVLHEAQPLRMAAEGLIVRANENGGHDNISVVLIRQVQPQLRGWTSQLMRRLQGSAR